MHGAPRTTGSKWFKSLASQFILSTDEKEKSEILSLVKGYLSSICLSGKSPAQIKKHIGVSYFGAVNSSQKTEKGKSLNYDTYIIYLSPSNLSGIQMCKHASDGCRLACLNGSGHALLRERAEGKANTIAISRLVKTWLVSFAREYAEKVICHEIELGRKKAKKSGHNFAIRLNGTSDLYWGNVIKRFPEERFYDYTKNPVFLSLSEKFENWHVTFSFSGQNDQHVKTALDSGFNVAFPVVGKKEVEKLIESGKGYSMDKTDLRFLDSPGNRFGLLSVKETSGTQGGIDAGFLLDSDAFISLHSKLA